MNAQNPDAPGVKELKAEIDRRNEGRADADKIQSDGNKADLLAAIQLDDEQKAGVTPPDATVPAQSPVAEDGEPKEVVQNLVTLVHTDGVTVVKVLRPSADYTNYVRGYGYTEQTEEAAK
jgi:hypothetical protein